MTSSDNQALDASQQSQADSEGRSKCLSLYIIYLSAQISVRPRIRVDDADPQGLGDLQLAFKKSYLSGVKKNVRANRAGCLDQCEHGPTVVVYPEGIWYGV